MNKRIQELVDQAHKRAQDEAWERCRKQLEKPELLAVFKRLKDR